MATCLTTVSIGTRTQKNPTPLRPLPCRRRVGGVVDTNRKGVKVKTQERGRVVYEGDVVTGPQPTSSLQHLLNSVRRTEVPRNEITTSFCERT